MTFVVVNLACQSKAFDLKTRVSEILFCLYSSFSICFFVLKCIFDLQGEGFRARQCFQNGRVDFEAYDRIFALECGEESADTLCRMACSRLLYPVQLQERERKLYEEYVSGNIAVACENLVRERDFSGIQKLFQMGILGHGGLQNCLERAVSMNWTEGVRQLLSLKEGEKKEGTEYGFKDF